MTTNDIMPMITTHIMDMVVNLQAIQVMAVASILTTIIITLTDGVTITAALITAHIAILELDFITVTVSVGLGVVMVTEVSTLGPHGRLGSMVV